MYVFMYFLIHICLHHGSKSVGSLTIDGGWGGMMLTLDMTASHTVVPDGHLGFDLFRSLNLAFSTPTPPQAFVDFFSRGLHAEYKSKGVIVQVSHTECCCALKSHTHSLGTIV